MFKKMLKKFGFIHKPEISALIKENEAVQEEQRLNNELAFNNRVFVGMPVIGINNYENVIEIAIIKRFEILELKNNRKIVPVMKLYYSNRIDGFHKDKENCVLSQYVAFSKQRLKAYLKLNGCERAAMLIKAYQLGTEDMDGLSILAPYQPEVDEVLRELEKTSFFEDVKCYDI